ncbi:MULTISPECIES: metallophosphoesterase [Luteibacter]|uniref:metallophosphoesterase n=1 Tax=Luteibacter TaxID=242605 RepID=UPI0005679EF2|nr:MULTISPECIES: metallophosphoesterase [unclassified Luteibacter]
MQTILPGRIAAALAIATVSAIFASSATAAVHTMIVTSDPQYPWTDATDAGRPQPDDVRNARSRALIEEQYRSIAAYRAARPGEDIPVFINGDLTAYGHGWQRDVMEELYRILGDNVHLGLGNHDYQNNIRQPNGSGCANNGCARDSIWGLVSHVTAKPGKVSFDFSIDARGLGNRYKGSLAYAAQTPGMDRVLQVQLNNYPRYAVSFDTTEGILPARFDIDPSVPWLRTLLDRHLAIPTYGTPADRAYDFALVHMHDASDYDDEFEQTIASGHVAAVFAGHYHGTLGRFRTMAGVPVFLSGSASQRSYLIVEHDTESRHLRVYAVRGNDPSRKTLVDTVPAGTAGR